MDPGTERTGPRPGSRPDTTEVSVRRPCRTRGCSGTRPLVEVGSSHLWDRCGRCSRRVLVGRPYQPTAEFSAVDPWAERVWELLELAEQVSA